MFLFRRRTGNVGDEAVDFLVLHRLRRDAVLDIIVFLDLAAAVGFADSDLHRRRHRIAVHDDLAFLVSGGAADRLDQGGFVPEEAGHIGVEDGDEGDFRQVEAFAQEIDPDEDVICSRPQFFQDLDAFKRIDFAVQVIDLDLFVEEVIGQLFGHALRQRRDEDALVFLHADLDFLEQVPDLVFPRPDIDLRVEQAGRADDLFDDLFRMADFVRGRRRADIDDLVQLGLELLVIEWTVIAGARQAEAEVDQRVLS